MQVNVCQFCVIFTWVWENWIFKTISKYFFMMKSALDSNEIVVITEPHLSAL